MSVLGISSRSMSRSQFRGLGQRPQLLAYLLLPPLASQERTPWALRSSPSRVFSCSSLSQPATPEQMEGLFISALVQAGTCHHNKRGRGSLCQNLAPFRPSAFHKTHRRPLQTKKSQLQALHTASSAHVQTRAMARGKGREFTREELKAIVTYYKGSYHSEAVLLQPFDSLLPNIDPSNANTVSVEIAGPSLGAGDEEETLALECLSRLIEDEDATHEQLFESYQRISFPGVSYLNEDLRRTLLRRLSVMQKKSERGAFRFLSVLDDMRAAELHITSGEWTSAIHLAGRCFARVTELEAESALRLWKEMEQEGEVQGSHVTFSVLFDIAVKAGKFVLAEMILREMCERKLSLDRFMRVGLIYYHGMREDGNAVRKAYRDLVESGEIVDTVVLNCVMASLLRAGELPAAEEVYGRMKMLNAQQTGSKQPRHDWKGSRELGRVLKRAARNFRHNPESRQRFQNEQSLAPDVHTFVIFLGHHVSHTGELHRVATLLDEMQFLGLPLGGRLFLELFRGFYNHGGLRYSSWTRNRLESVWGSYQDVLDDKVEGIYVGKWIAIWSIRAFAKCSDRERTLEIWEELKSRWKPNSDEEHVISRVLKKALEDLEYKA